MATRSRAGASVAPGGKEELRAALLKPYLLRLQAERGEGAVKQLLASTNMARAAYDNETAWVSVAAAKRVLAGVAEQLGREAIARRGVYMVHPEALGASVRLLRGANEPLDAYRKLCEGSAEASRVGTFSLDVLTDTKVRVTYRPVEGDDGEQVDELMSLAREAELAGLPRFWGLGDAEVRRTSSLAKGDRASVYEVTWRAPGARPAAWWVAGGALGGAALGALSAVVSGSWLAGALAGVVCGGLGGVAGLLFDRSRRERAAREVERHRIAALERGLQLRGDTAAEVAAPGELDGSVVGGKYKILRKIGAGGIGVVYSAEHMTLGSKVAVKVLRGAAARDASEIARLRREAQVQVSIEHPNVVRTLDLDQLPDGSAYVVMELLRGASLADKMALEGPIAPGFAVPAFTQVCRALQAAHDKGVVHRDLKPGNIFLCEGGTAKVLDFGMSKLQSAEALTQEGYTLGTPEYMAPEQCVGASVDPRTDLYAFGVLMYEALTGELPIRSDDRRELLELHQRRQPLSMRACRPDLDLPPQLDEAVMACLRKRPADRPRSAHDLERMLGDVALEGLPTSYARSSRRVVSRGLANAAARRGGV